MKEVRFTDWEEVLTAAPMPQSVKPGHAITIRWYLGFCRRARAGVNLQSARDFIEWVEKEKQPEGWKLENWKQSIRWFFRTAAEMRRDELAAQEAQPAVSEGGEKAWRQATVRVLRGLHYSYRTEQTYLGWIERFARHAQTNELARLGEAHIGAFLDSLATDGEVSASTQRQALNALVFLYRQVYERELGDLSKYRRAKAKTNLPVWLTKAELERLLAHLDGEWGLMARVMYGGGLRVMELLRLRVKDLGLEEGIITVRGGKGNKDRMTPLAVTLVEPLRAHLERIKKLHQRDRDRGLAGVYMPPALGRKYPKAGEEWSWFWVWSACAHPMNASCSRE